MTDTPKKFKSTNQALDDLAASLEGIIQELTDMLHPEVDCLSCGNEDSECPDCYECDADEEANGDV